MEAKDKKVKKIKPYTKRWYNLASQVATNFCPTIYPCKKCGHPVIQGYCCIFCYDTNPSSVK